MTQNVPMLKEKSEGQLNFTYGQTHVESQLAYSPIQNWMVVGNTWIDARGGNEYSNEVGVGYYHLNKDKNEIGLSRLNEIEVLGLYTSSHEKTHVYPPDGFPGFNPYYISYDQNFSADYKGYSLQVNTGKHFPRFGVQLAFSAKYTYLHYSDFYYLITEGPWDEYSKYKSSGGFETDSVYTLKDKNQQMLVLGFTFKIGKGWIKYMCQAGLHLNLAGNTMRNRTPPFYNPFIISNVLQMSFNAPGKKSSAHKSSNTIWLNEN